MNKKKGFMSAGALFMGLVIILGVLGIVNGLWSKNLIVNGTVETGDLNADWDCAYTNDDGVNFVPPTVGACSTVLAETGDDGRDPHGSFVFPYSSPFVEKDVADCTVAIDPADDDPDFGAQVATVTINNGYPSYECEITLYLSNTGSIPFNVAGSVLTLNADDPIEMLNDECGLEAAQVDPGAEEALVCTIHIQQEAAQNVCTGTTTAGGDPAGTQWPVVSENCIVGDGHYEFAIEACVAQWNETATFPQCKDSAEHEGPGGAGDGDGIVGAADLCPTVPGVAPDGCPEGTTRVESPPLQYGPNGWGGWSCPAGTHVVGGGYTPAAASVQISEAAEPGSNSGLYPVYPHYTFPAGETGWVVQNDNDSETITVFALCAPN